MSTRYTTFARVLHWVVAVVVLLQIALGLASDAATGQQAQDLLAFHVQFGLLIMALMVMRIAWRLGHPPPALPQGMARWKAGSARLVHGLLYCVMIVLPVSGYLLWMWIGQEVAIPGFGHIPYPDLAGIDEFWRSVSGYTHEYAAYALYALVALHVGAALWHECVDWPGYIRKRML